MECSLIKHRFFFRRKGEVLNSFFVCEEGTSVERLYRIAFKDDETLARILHVTGNDRLGTTAIYLNLIDMHVVDEYTQKLYRIILESTRNPGLNLFAGICKNPLT